MEELSTESLVKVSSFLFWSSLYLLSAVRWSSRAPEWHARLVTLLHGSVATAAGLAQCGCTTITPARLTMKISISQYLLMVWSWGYFAFDLLWCLIYWSDSLLMLCHHTSALASITVYMHKEYTGCTFACTLALLEVTNPLLQTRWFLRDSGLGHTSLFLLVEVAYLSSFLALRGVLGTFLLYKVITSKLFDMDEKLISVVFYIVSIGLIYDILGYMFYKYRHKLFNKLTVSVTDKEPCGDTLCQMIDVAVGDNKYCIT